MLPANNINVSTTWKASVPVRAARYPLTVIKTLAHILGA